MFDYIFVVAAIVLLCIAADLAGIPWYVPLIVAIITGIGHGLWYLIKSDIESLRR